MSQLLELYGESALPKPSLSELYWQLAQMMRSLERRIRAWDADAPASEESLARFREFLARNESYQKSPSGPLPALPPPVSTQLVLSAPVTMEVQQVTFPTTTPLMGVVQPQAVPIPAQDRPMSSTISQQWEIDQDVAVLSVPSVHQSHAGGRETKGQD